MGRPQYFRPMHVNPYRYPHGYGYVRYRTGMFLPLVFLGSSYIFTDYSRMYLGAPPRGHYWVRLGPDLLLVHAGNRQVVDVIYGAFY